VSAAPGCSNAVSSAAEVTAGVEVPVAGAPFGVSAAPDGRTVFVALNAADASQHSGVAAVDLRSHRTVGAVAMQGDRDRSQYLGGATLTHDGRLLVVAAGYGVAVFDAARVRASAPNALLGTLRSANEAATIQVAVSPDDRYVAASEENAAAVTLFDLRAALADDFAKPDAAASVQVNPAPVGIAFTSDGASLLVTSQSAGPISSQPAPGTISLIDVRAAIHGDADAVRSVASAGCSPVRLAVAPDGRTVWVTARGSNALLAFDVERLRSRPDDALLGWVRVGTAPVGVALDATGTIAVVANSNRFDAPNSPSTISLIDTASVLRHKPRTIATVAAGGFPREVAITANGAAAVTDFGTQQLTLIDPLPVP
jgi:DNA-binding beta-propeller fold protein YncE